MLIIRKNEVNNPIATVSMNKTLSNPYYLFSFQHIASKERVSFIPRVVTSNCRYDRFRFIETTNTDLSLIPPAVNFPYLGQYYYSIYEQVTSGNTNPALAFNKLESGRAVVILGNDNPDDCFFEPYISNDEDFANVIYLSEQEEECIAPPTPTPTPTPTITPTLTATPTLTPTTSCSITTQYLEVQLSDSTKFKLILWNQADYTSAANALCDYVISGCAYGDLGTVYCGTETITSGQHQHQFNLSPVLLPGEIVTGFTVNSYTLSGCVCPVNLIYAGIPTPTPTLTATATPTLTPTLTPTPTSSQIAWTPADFTGIWDWWSSDYGVNVINTDDVDQWTGHNGNVLTAFNTSYYPKKINSDADFDNQPSVEINSSSTSVDAGMLIAANANDTDKTFLLVCRTDAWLGGNNLLITINQGIIPRMGLLADVSNGYFTSVIDSAINYEPFVGTVPTAPVYQFLKLSYNRSTGEYIWGASSTNDFNTNINTTTGATSMNYTGGNLHLACYEGVVNFSPNIRVVEFIAIDGVPTTNDYNNFEAYLTSKYGL